VPGPGRDAPHLLFVFWFEFELVESYLPGADSSLVDDLLHNRLSHFLSKAQSPDTAPTFLYSELPELLLQRRGWISPCLTGRFVSIVTTG
jgi:hypothetical protein